MKILHTSDWHLGKNLKNLSRLEEQKKVLEEIVEIAEQEDVDVVLIAGDIFDTKTPSNDATDLLFKTLKRLSREGRTAVLAIAGNHDSPDRIEIPDPLAKECGIFFFGYPFTKLSPIELPSGLKVTRTDEGFIELFVPRYDYPLRLIATPYANEVRLQQMLDEETEIREILQQKWLALADQYCDSKGVNMLMTHFYVTRREQFDPNFKEPTDTGEKLILTKGGSQAIFTEIIPTQMQYVALGHLHKMDFVSKEPCPIVYSSSPLAYSFSEADQHKYIIIVEAQPDQEVSCNEIRLNGPIMLRKEVFSNYGDAKEFVRSHPEDYLDITIDTTQSLLPSDRADLYESHPFILELKVSNSQDEGDHEITQLDLNKSSEELFIDFYKHKRDGREPDKGLLEVFNELFANFDE